MHYPFFISAASVLLFSLGCRAQPTSATTDFLTLQQAFRFGYESLDVPGYRLSYVDNLAAIGSGESVEQQAVFFTQVKKDLAGIKAKMLSPDQYLDYQIMTYETEMNLDRLALEADWNKHRPDTIPTGGLSTVHNGKAWYRYFLKRWVDLSVEPDKLYAFGIKEVKQVKAAMQEVARRNGRSAADFHQQLTDSSRYFNGATEVKIACEALHQHLLTTLPDFFPEIERIPALEIAKNPDKGLAEVPGFYRNQTFFYTYFDHPFEKRQIGWLYTHEGLPGHHYERNYTRQLAGRSAIAEQFRYSAYTEGWAAYIEEIGKEFGAYPTDFDEYGKWEWDLNIARREIARMRRWPAQVITYKYGAETILRWQKAAAKKKDFNWVDFHTKVLQYGPLPLSLLDELITKEKS